MYFDKGIISHGYIKEHQVEYIQNKAFLSFNFNTLDDDLPSSSNAKGRGHLKAGYFLAVFSANHPQHPA